MSRLSRLVLVLLASAAAEDPATVVAEVPTTVPGAHFFEPFVDGWDQTWKVSKDAEFKGTWKHEGHTVEVIAGDKALIVGDEAQKHAVSTLFPKPFVSETGGLVIQYESHFQNTLQCGGAYLKLLTASEELSHDGFHAGTPYTLMFGPDSCGDTKKVHFIVRHQNPISGEWEEKHLTTPPIPNINDKRTHLFTAIVSTDNTVKILVDNEEKRTAKMLDDDEFDPPFNPPEEVDDPDDSKPDDWIDQPKIDEPGATKPDDWDEDAPKEIGDPTKSKPEGWLDDAPEFVPDTAAVKPDDWDADEDGEWEAPLVENPDCKKHGCGEWKAPLVPNPAYKGKWSPPLVDNPDYKGVWNPRQIPNPHHFKDEKPYALAPIGGIGIELWTMQSGIVFDNILLTSEAAVASALAAKTFVPRKEGEEAHAQYEKTKMKGKGFVEKMSGYLAVAAEYIKENPLLVGGSVCIGLIPLLLLCFMSGKSKDDDDYEPAPRAPPSAPPSAPEPDGGEDEGEEEVDAKADEPPAVPPVAEEPPAAETKKAKKRTQKIS